MAAMTRRTRWTRLGFAAAYLVTTVLAVLSQLGTTAPWGFEGLPFIALGLSVFAPMSGAFLGLMPSLAPPAGHGDAPVRIRPLPLLVLGLPAFLFSLWLVGLAYEARLSRLDVLELTTPPLVAAIEAHVRDTGRVPSSVDELVPRYLPEAPTTGLGGHPDFRILTPPPRWRSQREPGWILRVPLTSLPIRFDSVVYDPDGSYPERAFGGVLERRGAWAFVWE